MESDRMKSNGGKILLFIFLGLILIVFTFSAGLWTGSMITRGGLNPASMLQLQGPASPSAQAQTTPTPIDREALFVPFWQAWETVHSNFVDQPVDDIKLMQGAIRGMLASLGDPHTSFMDPIEFQQANAPLEGEYEGIGAYVDTTGEFLTIITPMPGSPAEKAGLKPGDTVIAIDGEDMTGIDPNLVLRKILGPSGSEVELKLKREGVEDFAVKIIREKILIPSVESKMLDNNIAYINLSSFASDTGPKLRQDLKDLLAKNPKGLILDLRNDGGGYVDTAQQVVSEFLKEGTVFIEQYGDKSQHKYEIQPGGLATDIPLVVLVNGGTASASEITAGAIQDYKRGTLVGEKTYGKGSVQQWSSLPNDAGAIRVTIARWLTPLGRQINKIGLTPDIEVKLTQEDFDAKKDPQLDRAIQFLLKGN
jgi:carboxyl-terminal processing protease